MNTFVLSGLAVRLDAMELSALVTTLGVMTGEGATLAQGDARVRITRTGAVRIGNHSVAEIRVAQALSRVEGFELLAIKITRDENHHDPQVNMVRFIAAVKGRALGTEVSIRAAETLLNERQEEWGDYAAGDDGTTITLHQTDGLKTIILDCEADPEGGAEAVACKVATLLSASVFRGAQECWTIQSMLA